ncbi:MAG: S41 family peptidase [Gemmatimonadaceae bacterium]
MRPFALRVIRSLAAVTVLAGAVHVAAAQQPGVTKQMRDRGRFMLEQVRLDLQKHYYDSTFHGVDLDAAYAQADSQLLTARDNNHLFAIIAQFVSNLDDSHTNFYPPARAARINYGFNVQFIGDTAYIVRVAPDSDSEKQGLRRGDALLQLDRFRVERSTWGTLTYVYYALSPRAGIRLLVRSPDGAQRQIDIKAKITKLPATVDYNDPSTIATLHDEYDAAERRPQHYYVSLGDSILIWRMPSFIVERHSLEEMIKVVPKHRSLVLDLRNNSGGYVHIERQLLSYLFDRDVFVGMTHRRGKSDSVVIKPANAEKTYRGMLVVLVNSNSASASEMTARVLQLEGRGIVVGDRTAGAVVTSRGYSHTVGFGRVMDFGMQVSVMDVTMADGARLEKVGVIPDHLVLHTANDLVSGDDPQLAFALGLVGHEITPYEAARLFRSDREAIDRLK